MELNTANAWQQWYTQENKGISHERIAEVRSIHFSFLNTILAQNASVAIEIGVGTGTLGYSLMRLAEERAVDLEVIEIDYCFPFLQNANSFNGENKTFYINGDTFALPFGSINREDRIVFHQGLLEHFSDADILTMISEQLRVSGTVIATVPSNEYSFSQGLRGDERLMPIEDWSSIISNRFKIAGYYYGRVPGERYHICLKVTE